MNIIFDLDGTVLDVVQRDWCIYADFLKQKGFSPLQLERYWQLRRGQTPLSDILAESGADVLAGEFAQEARRVIEGWCYLRLDQVMTGMVHVLKLLHGVARLSLVTLRHCRENLERQLEYLGLTEYFTSVLSQASDREPWLVKRRLIESLGAEPTSTIMIGDTEADVLAGQALQIPTFAVTYGIRGEDYLRSLSPTYLVGSPDDLLLVVLAHLKRS